MKRISNFKRSSLISAMLASVAIGTAGIATAQDSGTAGSGQAGGSVQGPAGMKPQTGPVAGTPSKSAMYPARTDSVDTAFTRLDAGGKGYVTKDQTQAMDGFNKSFEAADMNHDGRLTRDEFNKAWTDYSKK